MKVFLSSCLRSLIFAQILCFFMFIKHSGQFCFAGAPGHRRHGEVGSFSIGMDAFTSRAIVLRIRLYKLHKKSLSQIYCARYLLAF